MAQLKQRWKLIKSYIGWEDYLGFAIFLIGVLGFIIYPLPVIHEMRSELVGIGITVLIIDNANEAIKRREEKKRLIVGVNEYAVDEPLVIPVLKIDPEVERKQLKRLHQTRKKRDNSKVAQLLDRLRKVAEGTENLLPHILAAVKEYATVGEFCEALKGVFGEYQEPIIF